MPLLVFFCGRPHNSIIQVYVGNLSWECQWQDLKDHMRAAGNVKFVDLFQEPGGRSKGCAVVEYETPKEAHSAIRDLHDTELLGRLIFVREDREVGPVRVEYLFPWYRSRGRTSLRASMV